MSPGLLWLLIPVAPLLAGTALAMGRYRILPWLWLTTVPALVAVAWPPDAFAITMAWPDAIWGANDLVTRGWLGFTALLWACASVFAAGSLRQDPHRLRFWGFWLLALSGNFLLVIAQDGLSFYVGFTMMSLAAYGLVVHFGGPLPRRAGRLYLQLAVTGEMLIFAGLLMRAHGAGGALDFESWQTVPLEPLTLVLLLVGFGLKAGFWPLHVWLPLAHPAAPSPASAVLSGAMIKAGILGLWRFLPDQDPLLQQWAGVLVALGLFSAFYGVLVGLMSAKAKTALAYSSISQMGYLLMIMAIAWDNPAHAPALTLLLVVFAIHHGLAKGALFLATGVVAVGRLAWGYWLLLALPALALAGLPFTSGAVVKTLLKQAFTDSDLGIWALLLQFASVGTALLLLRALFLLWRSQKQTVSARIPLGLLLPWALLSILPLALPWLWPAMREPLLKSFSLDAGWTLLWPVVPAIILTVLLFQQRRFFPWRLPDQLPQLPNPTVWLSLRLKRLIQRPPVPPLQPQVSEKRWRQYERNWNRFWQSGSVTLSAWIICILLVLGWLL